MLITDLILATVLRALQRLSRERKQREEKAVVEVLSKAAVVCSTLSGVQARHIKVQTVLKFDKNVFSAGHGL